MNFENTVKIKNDFDRILSKVYDQKSEIKHLRQMLMYRFLSEIEKITDERSISKKELAKKIGVSASYITQLYRGNKPLNMETLAKIEFALDFRFDIKAIDKEILELNNSIENSWNEEQVNNFIKKFQCKEGIWIYKNLSKIKDSELQDNIGEVDYSMSSSIDKNLKQRFA